MKVCGSVVWKINLNSIVMFWCCLGVLFFRFVVFIYFFFKEKKCKWKTNKKIYQKINKIEGIILNLETEMDADVIFFNAK